MSKEKSDLLKNIGVKELEIKLTILNKLEEELYLGRHPNGVSDFSSYLWEIFIKDNYNFSDDERDDEHYYTLGYTDGYDEGRRLASKLREMDNDEGPADGLVEGSSD